MDADSITGFSNCNGKSTNQESAMIAMLGRIAAALIQTIGYTCVFVVQAAWLLSQGRKDRIAPAFAQYGKWTVDAVAAVFRR